MGKENRKGRTSRDGYDGGEKGGSRVMKKRRIICPSCASKTSPDYTDYKEIIKGKSAVSERGRILRRGASFMCRKHQIQHRQAILRARFIGFLPYVSNDSK